MEIEKAFSGSTQNLDSGVSSGMLGYFLTWMQERQSEGILVATANDLMRLPPEFLRSGRWDSIFFVDLPNHEEIKFIIDIMNRKYHSHLPTDTNFCKRLEKEGWTGAEIEQLAKDSHFEDIEHCIENIPILSKFKKADMEKVREKAEQFRRANTRKKVINTNVRRLRLEPKKEK